MKNIKRFENYRNEIEPEIGDYFVCHEGEGTYDEVSKFINNSVGKYVIYNSANPKYPYILVYNNIPEDLYKDFFGSVVPNGRHFSYEELNRYATPDEILEYESNKFNL